MSISLIGVLSLKIDGMEIRLNKKEAPVDDLSNSIIKSDTVHTKNTPNDNLNKKRSSRGEPYFYIDQEKKTLRRGHELEKSGRETMVTKDEFDIIVRGFQNHMTPTGKIKITQKNSKALGISPSKISAVRQLLSKTRVLSMTKGARTCYYNKDKNSFFSSANSVWTNLQSRAL